MASYGQLVNIKKDGSEGSVVFPVTKNEISIGSLASCDLRLTVPGVEQTHCTLLVHLNSSALLRNFSINNPVEVNGKPVLKNTLLQDGDKITISHKTFLWRSSSFEGNKAFRKSIATCLRSPGNLRNSRRRKSEPIHKLIAVVSPVCRSIDVQSPSFATTRRSQSLNNATKTSQGVPEVLIRNVTVRRKVNTRVATDSVKRWSGDSNLRKSILRTTTTPRANKSVRFNGSVNETTPEHPVWNIPRTPANAGFNASELSSSDGGSLSLIDLTNVSSSDMNSYSENNPGFDASVFSSPDSGSLSLIDLTNLSSSDMKSYSEDISRITDYLSTPGRSFKSAPSEPESTPQSSRVTVRFDESSARALLSPFNSRKSSLRQPATPYVKPTVKPLISFETPAQSLEVSSLISFETPAMASMRTSDTSLISFETPARTSSVSEMKSTAQREKTPFRPGSSAGLKLTSAAKPGTNAAMDQSEISPNPSRTKLLASPKLKVDTNRMPSKLKPKVKDQTPRRSTQLIRLKKKPVPATPVLNLGEVFKTPGKQGVLKSVANAKPEPKTQTPASMIPVPKVLSSHHNVLISSKEFSPAHPKIGATLRNGMPMGKTRGTYFPVNYDKRTPKSLPAKTNSQTLLKFIPKSMFTNKFTTPAKMNLSNSQNYSKATNEEITGVSRLNNPIAVLTPVNPSILGEQIVDGKVSSLKTPETTRVTRRSVATLDNVSKSRVSSALDCSSNAKTPKNTTVSEINIASFNSNVIQNTSAMETDLKYSPGQTISDLDFTNDSSFPPQNLSVLQNTDILLNMSTNSRITRKSLRTFEESYLLNSTNDTTKNSLIGLQTLETSVTTSAPFSFVNCSSVFKTPLKTPAKNARMSTLNKATPAESTVKTPVLSDKNKRSKIKVAQSTPNANEERLSVSLAFSDVCETPLKTPTKTGNTINNATMTMFNSGLSKTKSRAHSLCSSTFIDDAASSLNNMSNARKLAEFGTPAKNLNKTRDNLKKSLLYDASTIYELINSPEDWDDLSHSDNSAVHLSARKSKNESTFGVPSKSLVNISSRITRNSSTRRPRELSSPLSEEGNANIFITHPTGLSRTLLENSQSRVTRNSTFNAPKTLEPPPTRTSKSSRYSVCQTPSHIQSNETELSYELILNITNPLSKSHDKIVRSSFINEVSVPSRSNLDTSDKLEGTEFKTDDGMPTQLYSPNRNLISCSGVTKTSARKTRSTSVSCSNRFMNETRSSEKSLLVPAAIKKSNSNQQNIETSVEESDVSDLDESEAEISVVKGHGTCVQCEDEMLPRLSTLRVRSKTPFKTCVKNSNSDRSLPESPISNVVEVFKTPLKSLPSKSKTPARNRKNEAKSPLLDLGDMFKTPSKTPVKITCSSADREGNSVLNISTKTSVNVNSDVASGDNELQTPQKTSAKRSNSLKAQVKLTSAKKSKTPACVKLSETESTVTKAVSSTTFENCSSSGYLNLSSGTEESMSPMLNLFDIFGTPIKTRPKTPVSVDLKQLKSGSSATQAFDLGKLISSALNTANDVENSSFSSPFKSATSYGLLNRSVGSPLMDANIYQMLNKSNNIKTLEKLERSSAKENFSPETFRESGVNVKFPKTVLCESTTRTHMFEPLSKNENSSSGLSETFSRSSFELFPLKKFSKSARKSCSVLPTQKTTLTPETSFGNIAAIELKALSADGGKLRSKVMKPNAVSPILLDKLFEESRSKLKSLPGNDLQLNKVASYLNTVSEQNVAEPCDINVHIPATIFSSKAVKTPNTLKDVFVSPLPTDDKCSDNINKKLKSSIKSCLKKRASDVSKSSERQLSGSFSRRSNSSSFAFTEKRLSSGKVPKRKLRFHPDIPGTPEMEKPLNKEFSDEDKTIQVRRSTRKSMPTLSHTTRRSNRCKFLVEEVPEETNYKPVKKATKSSQPKQKPVSKQSKKASTKTNVMGKPGLLTKQTKLRVESCNISEPQQLTSRATRAKPEIESKSIENRSPVGKKRKSITAEVGTKRRKVTTKEIEEIDSTVQRQRQTRAAAAGKPKIDEELSTMKEKTSPEKKTKRQIKYRNEYKEVEENTGPSQRKTKSKMTEIQQNEQVEQSTSRRKTRFTVKEDEVILLAFRNLKGRTRGSAETAKKIVPAQTDMEKRNTRSAAKTTDKPKIKNSETVTAVSTQRKSRSIIAAKKTAPKVACEEVSPIKKTRSKTNRMSISQPKEGRPLPSRKRTVKVSSEIAVKRVVLKKVQTPSLVSKKQTKSTNQIADTLKNNQEKISPQRKTSSNIASQKQVFKRKTGRPSLGRRVTRSQK